MKSETKRFEVTPGRSADLRSALACFGTGVTVITIQTQHGPMGMTANSFSSVSLNPALVLWAPAVRSLRHDLFVESPHFCVHVLACDQLDMALHFAKQGDGFERFDWHEGPTGAPTLTGALAAFHCHTHAVHPAGDHSLVLGKVLNVDHDTSGRSGLLFKHSQFGRFSPDF